MFGQRVKQASCLAIRHGLCHAQRRLNQPGCVREVAALMLVLLNQFLYRRICHFVSNQYFPSGLFVSSARGVVKQMVTHSVSEVTLCHAFGLRENTSPRLTVKTFFPDLMVACPPMHTCKKPAAFLGPFSLKRTWGQSSLWRSTCRNARYPVSDDFA